MARTYPYLLPYRTCLGRLEDPCSFSSIYVEDLYSGQKTYIKHIQQIIDILPKTMDPSSRFTLRAQVTPLGSSTYAGLPQDSALVAPAQRW